MMVRVASGHFAGNVNLGGIAEVYDACVPYIWGKGVFFVYLMSQAFRYEFGLDEVLALQRNHLGAIEHVRYLEEIGCLVH